MRASILCLVLALAAAPCLAADSGGNGSQGKASAQSDQPTQAQLDAGKSLASTVITPGMVNGLVNGMVRRMVQRQSNLKPYSDTLTKFYKQYADIDDLHHFMARVYARNLSVKEMKKIDDFYQTPTGKKAMRMIPRSLQLAAQWSRQQVMKHRKELVSAMKQEAAKQKQQQSGGGNSSASDSGSSN